ncbi:MAG: type II toxin-antitoxin system Phd/YefM family antitoxin [Acidimicrobiia bacterium]|nr:type II toxin-antitoxin system Phd/YefM family antitoxin [Acidimicrobiia bacterium]MYF26561.1 type II toxin-antitoxin system Phd/YefM family antitoxin [Acidimicrobiia bacterium]
MSRIVTASDFRARCLKLMDKVSESGQEIVMTKHGRPVARLVPYQATAADEEIRDTVRDRENGWRSKAR